MKKIRPCSDENTELKNRKSQWYYCDDETITPQPFELLKNEYEKKARLLFYRLVYTSPFQKADNTIFASPFSRMRRRNSAYSVRIDRFLELHKNERREAKCLRKGAPKNQKRCASEKKTLRTSLFGILKRNFCFFSNKKEDKSSKSQIRRPREGTNSSKANSKGT